MFNKIQTNNHDLGKMLQPEKYILRKMGLNFQSP